MREIWIITKRELNSFFDSLIALILIIIFLGFNGYFTWFFRNTFFEFGQASMELFFSWAYWSLFIIIPGITMRSLAEETNTGTIEILSTKAVSNWQIILGKFISSWILILIALVLTIPYYITISKLGSIDHGATIMGYFGLMLVSAFYISIGMFASSISKNQVIAFIVSLFITFFFQFVFSEGSKLMTGGFANFLNFISANAHFRSMSRGVVDSRDLIYFFSMIFGALFLAKYILSRKTLID